jgi:hypothetical protein
MLQSSDSGWWTRPGGSRNDAVNFKLNRCLVLGGLLFLMLHDGGDWVVKRGFFDVADL